MPWGLFGILVTVVIFALDQVRRWRRRTRVRAIGPHGAELRAALKEIRSLVDEINITGPKQPAAFVRTPNAGGNLKVAAVGVGDKKLREQLDDVEAKWERASGSPIPPRYISLTAAGATAALGNLLWPHPALVVDMRKERRTTQLEAAAKGLAATDAALERLTRLERSAL